MPSLCAGGAERVLSFIAKRLDKDKFEVKLIVIGFENDTVYDTESLEVDYLNKSRLLRAIIPLYKMMTNYQPAFVVSSIGHVNIVMGIFSFLFRSVKFIGREASVASELMKFNKTKSKLTLILMKVFYPRLSAIVCQSQDMLNDFIVNFKIPSSRLVLIHNPITNVNLNQIRTATRTNELQFITIGRLSEEKGYLRIIEGLAQIRNYNFHYTIVGSGHLRQQIQEKARSLNLQEKISYVSFTMHGLEMLCKSDFFIQGSFVEGFPNALLESCSVGTPAIAFNSPGGTKEIIVHGVNGYLVENEKQFVSLLNGICERRSLNPEQVIQTVNLKFNGNKIVRQYENLFNVL